MKRLRSTKIQNMSALASTKRGALILFEGIDRCGKTTQTKRLVEYLSSKGTCEGIRFPDRTSVIGSLINDYLVSTKETTNVKMLTL